MAEWCALTQDLALRDQNPALFPVQGQDPDLIQEKSDTVLGLILDHIQDLTVGRGTIQEIIVGIIVITEE